MSKSKRAKIPMKKAICKSCGKRTTFSPVVSAPELFECDSCGGVHTLRDLDDIGYYGKRKIYPKHLKREYEVEKEIRKKKQRLITEFGKRTDRVSPLDGFSKAKKTLSVLAMKKDMYKEFRTIVNKAKENLKKAETINQMLNVLDELRSDFQNFRFDFYPFLDNERRRFVESSIKEITRELESYVWIYIRKLQRLENMIRESVKGR